MEVHDGWMRYINFMATDVDQIFCCSHVACNVSSDFRIRTQISYESVLRFTTEIPLYVLKSAIWLQGLTWNSRKFQKTFRITWQRVPICLICHECDVTVSAAYNIFLNRNKSTRWRNTQGVVIRLWGHGCAFIKGECLLLRNV